MTIYTGPVFAMAKEAVRQRSPIIWGFPTMSVIRRTLSQTRRRRYPIPVHMDNGGTKLFPGLPGSTSLTLGPTKGGVRFAPSVDIGEVAALSIWMSWKCALMGLPYGGAKGDVVQRAIHEKLSLPRTRSRLAPLYAGIDPVRRPRTPTSWRRTWEPTNR